jgi:hypothetical protein
MVHVCVPAAKNKYARIEQDFMVVLLWAAFVARERGEDFHRTAQRRRRYVYEVRSRIVVPGF